MLAPCMGMQQRCWERRRAALELQNCRAEQQQGPQLPSCPAQPCRGQSGALYLQDLIHDFLHDLTLSFRIAGAEKQEEIQVRKEDTARAQGEGALR